MPPPADEPLPYVTADVPGIGGRIKQRAEDFFVQEIPLYEPSGEGEHVYCEIQKVGLTKQDSSNFLERVLELVCAELERDEDVKFARFGNFVVRRKKARVGRNPKTGEEAPITARRVVSFKPSPLLRQRVEAAMSSRSS